jgi:plasmid stabilization system protein ParE
MATNLRTLRIVTSADRRIEEITAWYEDAWDKGYYNEDPSDDFYWAILDKFDYLLKFNEAGPEVPGRGGVRRLVITGRFEYYAFYRLTETEVVILAVTKDYDPKLDESEV